MAMPSGDAPVCTRLITLPVVVLTVKRVSEPAATAAMTGELGRVATALGVASAVLGVGCAGSFGSSSICRMPGFDPTFPGVIREIRLKNGRFSSSLSPCFLVPDLPFASFRASVWAMTTVPFDVTSRP